jgi:VanZ family protein
MNTVSKKIYLWIAVINFCFFIFFLSSVPDLKSGLDSSLDTILRKLAHAGEYFVLVFLLFTALRSHKINTQKAALAALIFAFLFAASDEYHQSFVPGREMALLDFLVDAVGATLSFYILKVSHKVKFR